MHMPDNLYSLLIRGTNLSESEQAYIAKIYHELGKDQFYLQIQKKKLLPFAANALVACGLHQEYWQEILDEYRRRNKAILRVLDEAYEELARQGVKKMFVSENFGALLSSGNDLALFASGDVDNHADPGEKEKIYRAFEVLGFTRKERFSGRHQIAADFLPPKKEGLPEKFYISVDFYPLARLKLPCFIRSDEFIDWEKLHCYEGTAVKLPPPDALMYICMLHISLHSFSKAPDIRLYIDLLNMSNTDVDYEKLATWCQRDKTCTRAAVAAQLSNTLMGTQIPECITGISSKTGKVLSLVYDVAKNALRYEPRRLKVFWIEICCHDDSMLSGLKEILFPDKNWMKQVYGGSGPVAHMKHIIKVL